MKNSSLILLIIFLTIIMSGCYQSNWEYITRNYTYEPSEDVTIYAYMEHNMTLNIYKSNVSEIKVIEEIYHPANFSESSSLLRSYVRYIKNDTNSSLYIRVYRPSDGGFAGIKASADIEVYLPNNTSYTVNYVDFRNTPTFKWPDDCPILSIA
jgi:hypothetical protein